ncbi:MAG: translation elongation factor Ts [candidate division Zixibacteria bacterium]|nr:translation elongation factor Ts [candidate division Zixibacteria bacterium]
MEITAKMVKELRDKTGAGMMDCKKALGEAEGDFEKAIDYLREKGISKAASKEGRTTAEGIIATYIHYGDKLGCMVEINCETDFVARTDKFKEFGREIAMHIAAAAPLCVNREEIDSDYINKEKEIYRQQALNDGKPEKIIDKIVDGKVDKHYSEVVLMEQPFVKDNEQTISEFVKSMIGSIGENILIKRFARFRLGE